MTTIKKSINGSLWYDNNEKRLLMKAYTIPRTSRNHYFISITLLPKHFQYISVQTVFFPHPMITIKKEY